VSILIAGSSDRGREQLEQATVHSVRAVDAVDSRGATSNSALDFCGHTSPSVGLRAAPSSSLDLLPEFGADKRHAGERIQADRVALVGQAGG
jgi:hypothetical protein